MIFVTVGMHHQGFERLIKAMDEVAQRLAEPVIMQIGASSYEPIHAEWFRFAGQEQVEQHCAAARLIVGHAGAGTIIAAFRHHRPLIVVPRRHGHGEHVDDHQLELTCALSAEGKVIAVEDPAVQSLSAAIAQAATLHPLGSKSSGLAAAISIVLSGHPQLPHELPTVPRVESSR